LEGYWNFHRAFAGEKSIEEPADEAKCMEFGTALCTWTSARNVSVRQSLERKPVRSRQITSLHASVCIWVNRPWDRRISRRRRTHGSMSGIGFRN